MSAPAPSAPRRAAAWGVHIYTATGFPLAFLAMLALFEGDASAFFLFQVIAALVDATDGALARRVRVKEVLPDFDGRRLDDIIDYMHFVFLPCLALPMLGVLPQELAWLAVVPMLASGYGFCQDRAKTEDSFVGFPSYWNVVAIYLYVMAWPLAVDVGLLVGLSVLVFVPMHYIYPSRTALLKPVTVVLGALWAGMVLAMALYPESDWARNIGWISLFYPVYYFGISMVHDRRVRAREAL